jgi:hypothetical protein
MAHWRGGFVLAKSEKRMLPQSGIAVNDMLKHFFAGRRSKYKMDSFLVPDCFVQIMLRSDAFIEKVVFTASDESTSHHTTQPSRYK